MSEEERGRRPRQRGANATFGTIVVVFVVSTLVLLSAMMLAHLVAASYLINRVGAEKCEPEYTWPFAITIVVYCVLFLLRILLGMFDTPQSQRRKNILRKTREWLSTAISFLTGLILINAPILGLFSDDDWTACSRVHLAELLLYVRVFYINLVVAILGFFFFLFCFIGVVLCAYCCNCRWVDDGLGDGSQPPRVGESALRELTRLVPFSELVSRREEQEEEKEEGEEGKEEENTANSSSRSSAGISEEKCAICLSSFTEQVDGKESLVRVLKCGHYFHDECVSPYLLERVGACPLCKQSLADAHDLHGKKAEEEKEKEEGGEEFLSARATTISVSVDDDNDDLAAKGGQKTEKKKVIK